MRYKTQRGIIMIIALVIMAAMTLAAIALVRTIDTGILVAANLAFRQSATMAGDNGLRAGTTWLVTNSGGTTLHSNQFSADNSYWANAQNAAPAFDPITYDWTSGSNSHCTAANCAADAAGNVSRYVIHRLCDGAGNPIGVKCVRPPATAGSTNNSSKGVVSAGSLPMTATANAYYRISVRISGPRNTNSYVQAIVY